MLTLFHAPQSRSTTCLALIDEMGLKDWVKVREVTIPRFDGTGGRDPDNPHPEGKVPALVHDEEVITERAAIILHLCTMFPDTGLSPAPGTAAWGRFLTWLAWYHSTVEPAMACAFAQIDHPVLRATWRDMEAVAARLHAALARGPWLLGETYSAADLLLHSPFNWFPDATPDDPLIRDWIARCMARPAAERVRQAEAA